MRADQPVPREVCVEPRARRAASRAVVLGECGDGRNPSQDGLKTRHGRDEFPDEYDRKR